ncbi:hypothetical protein JTE90_022506 [Oedothorax gibbosus]|uniref:Uncharacterized protein n=1 Tax=Oedothorax gibbosus TaxID=931172 RepID=A0AAV6V116_9ARAC|nr:hypothetical protein JTE90_022506 [Oedothorax gibbosus]
MAARAVNSERRGEDSGSIEGLIRGDAGGSDHGGGMRSGWMERVVLERGIHGVMNKLVKMSRDDTEMQLGLKRRSLGICGVRHRCDR